MKDILNRCALNKTVRILMDMMNIADQDGAKFEPRLGLGYLAFSAYVSRGIAEIAELKYKYMSCKRSYEICREHEKDLEEILQKAFGDEEFESLPEDVQKNIFEASQKIIKEWEDKHDAES